MIFRYIQQMSNARKEKIRTRLALMYAVVAWNGFAICLYYISKKEKDRAGLPPDLYQTAMTPQIESSKVIKFNGLSYAGTTTYDKEDIEEARRQIIISRKPESMIEDF